MASFCSSLCIYQGWPLSSSWTPGFLGGMGKPGWRWALPTGSLVQVHPRSPLPTALALPCWGRQHPLWVGGISFLAGEAAEH